MLIRGAPVRWPVYVCQFQEAHCPGAWVDLSESMATLIVTLSDAHHPEGRWFEGFPVARSPSRVQVV